MNNTKIKNGFILASFVLLTSCAPIYIPNNVNTPLLTEAKEFTLNMSTGMDGFDCQLAYAVTDDIGLMLNGAYLSKDGTNIHDSEVKYTQQQKYIETALGWFQQPYDNFVVETYLGGGIGKSSSTDSYLFTDDKKIYGEGNFYKLFVQSDMGFKSSFLEGGVALRGAYINFYKMHHDLNLTVNKFDGLFIEPAVFLRIGGPVFKIQSQFGFTSKLSNKKFLIYEPYILSIGFILRINSSIRNNQ